MSVTVLTKIDIPVGMCVLVRVRHNHGVGTILPGSDPCVYLPIQSPGEHAFEAQQGNLIAFNFN